MSTANTTGAPEQLAVTIGEAAAMLAVSADTIRREMRRGKLRGIRIGSGIRIRRTEIEAYMKRAEMKEGQ